MKLSDFKIGDQFISGQRKFQCTDIGTRVVIAIPLDVEVSSNKQAKRQLGEADARAEGWHNGPPYAVQEIVFDEYDIEQCERETAEAL